MEIRWKKPSATMLCPEERKRQRLAEPKRDSGREISTPERERKEIEKEICIERQ